MEKTIVMGIRISDRESDASNVQKILTDYGCIIKTRIGLHEATNVCSTSGLIILEFVKGKEDEIEKLKEQLGNISSVIVKTMEF